MQYQGTMKTTFPINKDDWRYVEVYGADFRDELIMMAKTVDKLNLWHWFKAESPPTDKGYSFWGHENVDLISNSLPQNNHSGATFAFAMRQMQFIAKNGFDHWNNLKQ